MASIASMNRQLLVSNIVSLARTACAYGVPVVLSTVNVKAGKNKDTIAPLREVLTGIPSIDRTSINAWEDEEFVAAVKATGRKKLVMAALWTEVCLTFPSLDALREGYEVYPVVDAVGGTSIESHRAGLERIVQAGGHPTSWAQFVCELQRDWALTATLGAFVDILFSYARETH
jgi:nicotinamidase-related amidase